MVFEKPESPTWVLVKSYDAHGTREHVVTCHETGEARAGITDEALRDCYGIEPPPAES
jgi:hypothetical protein